jgi:hypothetical protein
MVIIPAHPGFAVIYGTADSDEISEHPIVAWAIDENDRIAQDPVPITTSGRKDRKTESYVADDEFSAIRHPDGSCVDLPSGDDVRGAFKSAQSRLEARKRFREQSKQAAE